MACCHAIFLFVIWSKVLSETTLTFRPRCTWAVWGPSCGAAAGTGPDRCSAGTGLASAWTPGYNTGCQLVVQATAPGVKRVGIMHTILLCANLEKETYCWCHAENFHGNGWRVETLGNKFYCFVSMGSRDCISEVGAPSFKSLRHPDTRPGLCSIALYLKQNLKVHLSL